MPVATEETFGSQVFDELRRLSGFDVVTQSLTYDGIQKLKMADQATSLRLFQAVGISINSDQDITPHVVATCVLSEARNRESVTPGLVVADIIFQILSGLAALV